MTWPAIKAAIERGVSRQRVSQLRHPVRHRARKAVYRAVQSGRLERPESCSRCGKRCKTESHHEDYSKPLEVEWLCRECHGIADIRLRPKKTEKPRGGAPVDLAPGARLRQARTDLGFSQRRMAAFLGCSKAMVTQMESGLAVPGRTLSNRIEALVGLPSADWDDPADLLPQDGTAEKGAAA